MFFVPIVLSALLLAAHFLRYGALFGMLITLAFPALLFTRRRWSVRLVQSGAFVATLIWLAALGNIIAQRMMMGVSWTASAIILGSVAAFTLFSAILLEHPAARKYFS